jgi:hypothetical protein
VQPDGPVLWGYGGGALGVMSGGPQAMLSWNNSGVSVNGTLSGNGAGLTNLDLGTSNSFSPTIGDGQFNFAMSRQSGYYAKMGNLVYFEIWLQWSGLGSANPSSSVEVSLPFSVVSTRASFAPGFLEGISFGTELKAGANGGSSYLFLYKLSGTGGSVTNVTVSNCISTGGELQISGLYRWQ